MGAKRNKQLGSSSLCCEWNKNPPQLFLSVCISSRTMQLGVMAVTAPFFGAWWIWKKSCWCCSLLKTGNISGCWPQDVSEYSCEHLPQLDSECTGTNHTHHGENCIFPWPHIWNTYIDQTKKDPSTWLGLGYIDQTKKDPSTWLGFKSQKSSGLT